MDTNKHIDAVEKAFSDFTMINNALWQYFEGDATPAALFGYLTSEAKFIRETKRLDSHGYFWCKADKLQEKTHMSRRVQDSVVKKLVAANLIDVHTKPIEGSTAISKVRHFKINYEVVYNIVNGIKDTAKPVVIEDLPEDLAAIRNDLRALTEAKGAKFYHTKEDEQILRVARNHGYTREISLMLISERVTFTNRKHCSKYLIKSIIPDLDNILVELEKPKDNSKFKLKIA